MRLRRLDAWIGTKGSIERLFGTLTHWLNNMALARDENLQLLRTLDDSVR
jgi:hypothetical protein